MLLILLLFWDTVYAPDQRAHIRTFGNFNDSHCKYLVDKSCNFMISFFSLLQRCQSVRLKKWMEKILKGMPRVKDQNVPNRPMTAMKAPTAVSEWSRTKKVTSFHFIQNVKNTKIVMCTLIDFISYHSQFVRLFYFN